MVSGSGGMPAFSISSVSIAAYIEELENYMLAYHGECTPARKKAALMTAIGPEGKAVIANFTEVQRQSYDSLCTALRTHYATQKHTFVERHTFFSIYQLQNRKGCKG